MIELRLTNKQARKILVVLNGPSVVDIDIAVIYNEIKRDLDSIAEINAARKKAPWRKVVDHKDAHGRDAETLECGHKYILRQSFDMVHESNAKKRRCKVCATKTC